MSAHVTVNLRELLLLKAEARGFSFLPRQPRGSLLAGRHNSRLRGRGVTFEELRAYHQGDDIRSIDWKATARLQKTHVRTYTEERERPVLFVVDQRQTMFFGSRRAMKSVAAAELAAIGAWRTLDVGDCVGGIVFNDREAAELRPRRSRAQVLRFLQNVVDFNNQLTSSVRVDGSSKLNESLRAVSHIARHNCLVVIISDFEGADDDTQSLITRICAHNDVLVCAVYDPVGISLQGTPGMYANTGQKTVQIPADKNFPPKFQASFERLVSHWRDVFRSLRVPILPVSAARPVPEQIRVLFGNRK